MNMEKINIVADDRICTSINRYLSRYQTNDDNLRRSIRESYLWFSDPSDFNDPYDCNMEVGHDCTYEEMYAYLSSENLKHKHGVSDTVIKERAKYLSDNTLERKKLYKKSDEETIEQLGVCCFSQRNDSLLMWSHYGNKHKGICLTFDVSKDKDFFGKHLFNLEYPSKFPIYNWPRDRDTFKLYRFLVATKSQDWQYEDEIRVVRDSTTPPFRGMVKFAKEALLSIHFGYKSGQNDISQINCIFRRKFTSVPG